MILKKLAISNFATRKMRSALTVAAIALSVSLVVSVTSGYASIQAAAFKFLSSFMMTHDVRISRNGDRAMPESLADQVATDPDVKSVLTRLEFASTMLDLNGATIPNGRLAHLMGIHRPADRRVETMTLHEGGWFSSDQGQLVVIDQAAARLLKESDPDNEDAPSAHVGDSFDLPGPGGKLRVTIVGI